MAQRSPAIHRVRGEKSLALLASPVRIELIGALQTHGPSSIRELARHVDRPADGLYHHVRKLLKAGALRETEPRKVGRHLEAVYALTATRVGGALDPSSPGSRQGIIRAAHAALRMAAREFAAAIDTGEGGCEGPTPRLRVSRQKAWLTEPALVQLHSYVKKIERLLRTHNERKRGRLYALTTVLSPLVKRRRQ